MTFQQKIPRACDKFIPPVILVVLLMTVYLKTMAPGLTWANDGSDGGDLITAAFTGGVPHPTGYPLYLLLAKIFQLIPAGSLAFRTNLMSAVAAVCASILVYAVVTEYLAASQTTKNWLPGLIAGFSFGLSPLLWSQAVITEVYTLHAFFAALLLYLSSGNTRKNLDRMLGLTFGLAAGNHMTIILTLPVLFSSVMFRNSDSTGLKNNQWQVDIHAFWTGFFWLGIGLLTYVTLPLRALHNPPVNWGNPVTFKNFVWLVSGRLYQGQIFAMTIDPAWGRMRGAAGLLVEQFGIPGLLLGLIGLIVFFKPSRLYRNTLWIAFAFFVFSIGYAVLDSYVNLIPAFLSFSVWIGLGASGLMKSLSLKFRRLEIIFGLAVLLYLFFLAGNHCRQVDASQDFRADDFGREVLAQAPDNAIVFASGDKAVFTMWYFHFALGSRPDLAIVAPALLPYDWYRESLRHTYPQVIVTDIIPTADAVRAANPQHPVCFIEYIIDSKIDCAPYPNP